MTTTAAVTTGGAESRAPLLETNSPAMSTLIDRDQVANLPLDGRNFLELALLAPGTVPAPQGSASSVRGDFAFSTNGGARGLQQLPARRRLQRRSEAEHAGRAAAGRRHPRVRGARRRPTTRRSAGTPRGQVNVLTRSGANTVVGIGLRVLPQRRAGRAQPLRAGGRAEARLQPATSSAASIGGPLARNRTFFFADYERTRLREGITRVTNVPTARGARRRLLAVAVPAAARSAERPAAAGRADSAVLHQPDRRGDRRALSAAEPRRRRSRTTCRRRRCATTSTSST